MLARLRLFLEMIRFSHTLFALPFALWSATIAWRWNALQGRSFRAQDLLGILLCMVFARSAAMAFNRLVDRDLDAANARTRTRHIPAGLLSVGAVWFFCLASGLGFVASTMLFLPNVWPVALSLPVLGVVTGYSYAKRFTWLCHYWLGAALALAPAAAWIALRGEVAATPLWIGAAVFFWVGGFDIIYACQDHEFDRQHGLASIPARFGVPAALRIAAISHAAMLACLGLLAWTEPAGWVFCVGLLAVAILLVYEHRLVAPHDLARVNIAFFNVNIVVSLGLFVVGVLDLFVR